MILRSMDLYCRTGDPVFSDLLSHGGPPNSPGNLGYQISLHPHYVIRLHQSLRSAATPRQVSLILPYVAASEAKR